jgi:hypothetical protein
MSIDYLSAASRLSDSALLAEARRLAHSEFDVTACLIAHLAEVESRGLYFGQGCASLFAYCVDILHLSEHAAYLRIEVARACRKYPLILEMLGRGTVNLTNASLLVPVLTPENHRALLAAATHKPKRAVEDLVEEQRPARSGASPAREAHRRASTSAQNNLFQPGATTDSGREAAADGVEPGDEAATPEPRRCRLEFMTTPETRDKLRRLQELLSYEASCDPAEILDRALTTLLREVERKKLAMTQRPRASRSPRRGSRHIPAAVRRAVWARDRGQCAFVGENGHRCTERRLLQWHHLDPHGDGGEATVSNIELRCPPHNRYEADLYFGLWTADPLRDPGALESHAGERAS